MRWKRSTKIFRGRRKVDQKKGERKDKEFNNDPFKFVKRIFIESKSGTQCTKEELEDKLKETYSDPKKGERFPYMKKLSRPMKPGMLLDMQVLKAREVDRFINKTRTKVSPTNDGVSYKVSKKYPRLRCILFLLWRKIWKKKDVAER